jgi:hypothetical protein
MAADGCSIQTACEQILKQGGPRVSGFSVAEEEPEDVGAPIGGQSEGGEEGLRVGCLPPEWQGDGIEEEGDDACRKGSSQPGLNIWEELV